MLPNIDPTNSAASVAAQTQPQVKRPELDKALEAYSNQTPAVQSPAAPAQNRRHETDRVTVESGEAQKAAQVTKAAADAKHKTGIYQKPAQDQAEINFQLTREERDAFINAISGQENPKDMTEREQTALQRAAERVEKLIEEATTRSTDRGERLDKAIKEWYSRLTNGKHKAPADLVRLIQQAAAGNLNFNSIEFQ